MSKYSNEFKQEVVEFYLNNMEDMKQLQITLIFHHFQQ